MGLIQDYLRKLKEKKEDKKNFAYQRYIEEDFEERKKNSDERELERFYEEDRKKAIKEALVKRRKQMSKEIWNGKTGNPIFAPNIIKDDKKLFNGKNNFAKVPSIMDTPNITKVKSIFMK